MNIKCFGATGNGIADNTVALQAAINVAASGHCPTVYLPAGCYKISAPLLIGFDNLTPIASRFRASRLNFYTRGLTMLAASKLHALEHAYLHLGHLQITCQLWRQEK